MSVIQHHHERLCNVCGDKPCYTYPGGTKVSRCQECERTYMRNKKRASRERQRQGQEDETSILDGSLCKNCHNAPRHRWPNGVWSTMCLPCHNAQNNANKRRRLEQRAEQRALQLREETAVDVPAEPERENVEAIRVTRQEADRVYAIQAEMLLLLDRSREAVASGALTGLRLAMDMPEGVTLSFSSSKRGEA